MVRSTTLCGDSHQCNTNYIMYYHFISIVIIIYFIPTLTQNENKQKKLPGCAVALQRSSRNSRVIIINLKYCKYVS